MNKIDGSLRLLKRALIIAMAAVGIRFPTIARKKRVALSTVYRVIQSYKETGSLADRPRSGRPSNITRKLVNVTKKTIRVRETGSLRRTQAVLERKGIHVSIGTIANAARRGRLRCVKKRKKPDITPEQKDDRVRFCEEHLQDDENDIARTCYSDEKVFVMGGSSQYAWISLEDEPPIRPTSK